MSRFDNLRRLRSNWSSHQGYEPHTLLDMLLDVDTGGPRISDAGRPVHRSVVSISVLGFRAQSEGRTGLAALKAMRRKHPLLVHGLCAYLSVTWFLVVLIAAHTIQSR
ncbi:hypothetical protein [Streptomyces sp. NPDC090053]|uniref:hypothetical protein n=1 Tax=Streptomyces sp. NPDC090053 TaxID=3365932 RepID=UPI00382271AA